MIHTVTRQELWEKIRSGNRLILIEMTLGETYERLHLPGAIEISFSDLTGRNPAERLPGLRPQDEVVLYSESELVLAPLLRAAHFLTALGYLNVAIYPGGKDEWILDNMPTESIYYGPGLLHHSDLAPYLRQVHPSSRK